MAQAKLTVSREQAKKIGLLTIHTDSKYPIIYDPKSGVNLRETADGEFIEVADGANLMNLLKLQSQGLFTAAEGVIDSAYDARLSELVFTSGVLDPAFDSDVYDYLLTLPNGATVPATVSSAIAVNAEATVVVTDSTDLGIDTTVEVTSANGEITRVYTIGFAVAAA